MFTSNAEAATQRGSDATMRLTMEAAAISKEVMSKITANEVTEEEVKATMQSHDAMDAFLEKLRPLVEAEYEWLKELDADTVDRMIKSQQSKRSRSKNKVMTEANYSAMMIGAIAENMLRAAHGKEKGSVGHSGGSSTVHYSEEMLADLQQNQEELRKAIRNIQSRKSIMKSKATFDEASEAWQALLIAEEQLKSIRVGAVTGKTVQPIKDILAGVDNFNDLKATDARALLEQIAKHL